MSTSTIRLDVLVKARDALRSMTSKPIGSPLTLDEWTPVMRAFISLDVEVSFVLEKTPVEVASCEGVAS